MERSDRLKKFSIWQAKAANKLKVPCRNRYGHVAHFRDYNEGVVLFGFGDEGGVEPDKDAFIIDKADLPEVIKFLQAALQREENESQT